MVWSSDDDVDNCWHFCGAMCVFAGTVKDGIFCPPWTLQTGSSTTLAKMFLTRISGRCGV